MKKEAHKQKAKAERIKQLTQHVFNKIRQIDIICDQIARKDSKQK